MIKPVVLIVLTVTFFGCATVGPRSDAQEALDALRNVEVYDSRYRDGAEAYVSLIKGGEASHKILSDAWAYGEITERFWIDWEHDFLTRYSDIADEIVVSYRNYTDQRLVNEAHFFRAAVKHLASEIGYRAAPIVLADWLNPQYDDEMKSFVGYRMLALEALKQIHPEIPNYDLNASMKIRTEQYDMIAAFLKEHEEVKPPAANDPFSN